MSEVIKVDTGLVEEKPKKKATKSDIPPLSAQEADNDLKDLLKGISAGLGDLNTKIDTMESRLDKIETGGANDFKKEAKPEDIESANSVRTGIDPKISNIVDEMLGVDFGATVKPLGDRPGFRFSVIVPERLSDNVVDKRPKAKLDAEGNKTTEYEKDLSGNTIFEEYKPEDRRSVILSSSDSYDAIIKHCDRVRGYIVGYFQKVQKPLPEFRVK